MRPAIPSCGFRHQRTSGRRRVSSVHSAYRANPQQAVRVRTRATRSPQWRGLLCATGCWRDVTHLACRKPARGGDGGMKFVLFYHSFISFWNRNMAHSTGGIARTDRARTPGGGVRAREWLEPGQYAAACNRAPRAETFVPGVGLRRFPESVALPISWTRLLDGADLVIAHEWTHRALCV